MAQRVYEMTDDDMLDTETALFGVPPKKAVTSKPKKPELVKQPTTKKPTSKKPIEPEIDEPKKATKKPTSKKPIEPEIEEPIPSEPKKATKKPTTKKPAEPEEEPIGKQTYTEEEQTKIIKKQQHKKQEREVSIKKLLKTVTGTKLFVPTSESEITADDIDWPLVVSDALEPLTLSKQHMQRLVKKLETIEDSRFIMNAVDLLRTSNDVDNTVSIIVEASTTNELMDHHPILEKVKSSELLELRALTDKPKVTEGAEKCRKCGSKETLSSEKQTRSADEPMTVFVHCMNCGNKWKF